MILGRDHSSFIVLSKLEFLCFIILPRTVWYELLTGCWPFKEYPAESIIWQVGNRKKQSLGHLQGSKELKVTFNLKEIYP